MAATPSIKMVQSCEYKGGTKVFSNRFHFAGGVPPTEADWGSLTNDILADMRTAAMPTTLFVEAICYLPGSDLPLYTFGINDPGLGSQGIKVQRPLEVAGLLRWATDQRTTKNHPIYLFSYIHNVNSDAGNSIKENWQHDDRDNWQLFVNNFLAGYVVSGVTYKRAGPNGAVAQSGTAETYLTHRDFRN